MIVRTLIAALALMSAVGTAVAKVNDATPEQVKRVEPLSWWTGMKNDLQVMVQGKGISSYKVSLEGLRGESVSKVHKDNHFLGADLF